jgi:hypothetical protein
MVCTSTAAAAVEVAETEEHGKALVSTACLKPGHLGLLVFREEALLTCPVRGSKQDNSGPVPHLLEQGPQLWTDWWAYRQQPENVKQRVLDMYSDMNCPHAEALRRYLEEKAQMRREQRDQAEVEEKMDPAFRNDKYDILDNIEEFVKLTMVVRFNAVELCPPSEDGSGPGTDYGYGFFETACKMSHSCKPNCVWVTEQSGTAKLIRAISKIEMGEELTVDYVGQILSSIPERREELWSSKGFLCNCDRCAASGGDDTRRFPCIHHESSRCTGVHLVHQPRLSSTARLLPCSQCQSVATEAFTQHVIQEESELRSIVREIDRVENGDADGEQIIQLSDKIKSLDPPHHLHGLAEECYRLQGTMYSLVGDYRSAAEAYSKQIKCRAAILGDGYFSQTTAFCCERLGDILTHVNVQEAEEAYKRSVRDLLMTRGGGADPYSKCALAKLLAIQSTRRNIAEVNLPRESIDVPNGPPKAERPCEVCGNPSTINNTGGFDHHLKYCCEEHRRMHLSVVCQKDTKPETSGHCTQTVIEE